MSMPTIPSRVLRASTRFSRNRRIAQASRSICTTPPASAPAAALLAERPAYEDDEFHYQTNGYEGYESRQIDWREWPMLPLEALEAGYTGELQGRAFNREVEWPAENVEPSGSPRHLQLSEQKEAHEVHGQSPSPAKQSQSENYPQLTIPQQPASTQTLHGRLDDGTRSSPFPKPNLSQPDLDRMFLNRLSSVTNKIEYRRTKNRSKRSEDDEVEEAVVINSKSISTAPGAGVMGDHVQTPRWNQAELLSADSVPMEDGIASSLLSGRKARRQAGQELAQQWRRERRANGPRSHLADNVGRGAITADDVWEELTTTASASMETNLDSNGSPAEVLTVGSSSGSSNSFGGASSSGVGGSSSSSAPPPDRPFAKHRPKASATRRNPSIPTVQFDSTSMSLLTSITSFRRPPTKSPTTLAAPDVKTLFALKPTRATIPHHTSKHYKADYQKLWDRVWVTFTAPKIIGVYNDMMDLPDPMDNKVTTPVNADCGKWPRLAPSGAAKTGIWIRAPTPDDPNRKIWQRAVKRTVVTEILSVWGWRPLEQLEADAAREKFLAKMGKKDLELTEAEEALIVRKDGRELSEKFPGATFSLVDVEAGVDGAKRGGRALRVRATGKDQLEIGSWLEERRKMIKSDALALPEAYSLERLYSSICRHSGAHLSTHSSSTDRVVVRYTTSKAKEHAQSLLLQARQELLLDPARAVVFSLTPSHTISDSNVKYALYPHLSAATNVDASHHWKFAGMSLFRMRRTGGWFSNETTTSTSDEEALGSTILRGGATGAASLESALLSLHAGEGRIYTITQGHLLYPKQDKTGPSLVAPLAGSKTLAEIKSWTEGEPAGPVFSAVAGQASGELAVGETSRRLRYVAISKDGQSRETTLEVAVDGDVVKVCAVEESIVNLSRPERATDLQVVVKYSSVLKSLPLGLEEALLTAPQSIQIGEEAYQLYSNEPMMGRAESEVAKGEQLGESLEMNNVSEVMRAVRSM